MGEMMRAVINFANNISPMMPLWSKVIEGCGYNPDALIMAFRYLDMGIIVEPRRIIINNTEDIETAQSVIDWLNGIIKAGNM